MSSFQSLVQLSPTKAVLAANSTLPTVRSSSRLKAVLTRKTNRLRLPQTLNLSIHPLSKSLRTRILPTLRFSIRILTILVLVLRHLTVWLLMTTLTIGISASKISCEVLSPIVKFGWRRFEKRLYRFRQDCFWHFMCWVLNPNALLLLLFWPGWLLVLGIWLSW